MARRNAQLVASKHYSQWCQTQITVLPFAASLDLSSLRAHVLHWSNILIDLSATTIQPTPHAPPAPFPLTCKLKDGIDLLAFADNVELELKQKT